MVRLFISHSSDDELFAALVVDLLSKALHLRAQEIRCTSVEGHRLPGGSVIEDRLRSEVLMVEAFVGIVTPAAMASAYVLFELGARWGAQKQLVPLLGPGLTPQALKGPLRSLHALSCDRAGDLHQLIEGLAEALGCTPESPAAYQRQLDGVMHFAKTNELPIETDSASSRGAPSSAKPPLSTPTPLPTPTPIPALTSATQASPIVDEYSDAKTVIAKHCERQWPDDYKMRQYCITQQSQALAQLRSGRPSDVPASVFEDVRRKCAIEWPDDYGMRLFSEQQQLAAYRQLQSG